MSDLAARLKQLRTEQGFSQSQLGEYAGVNYNLIGRYERRASMPSADTLARLAEVLDVSSDYLLEGERDSAIVADFEDKELMEHFLAAQQLEYKDKVLIKEFLGAFLVKKQLQDMLGD